jgi:SAM-dependent methyltransferase
MSGTQTATVERATPPTEPIDTAPTEMRTLADINRVGTAFFQAKVLQAAVDVGLFTALAQAPATQAEICARVGLHPRCVRDFLHALVSLGAIRREGDVFTNSAAANEFLDRAKPTYGGAFLERAGQMMYPIWGSLAGLLRTGDAQLPDQQGQRETFADMMTDPARIERFLRMMDAVSGPLAPDIAAALDWTPFHSVVDVGGARGNLVAQIVDAHPHLAGGVFDLPPLEPAFHAHMTALGRAGLTYHGGDFFTDPMPAADVIVMGHVLHDWAPAERRALVASAYRSVNPGGALLVYDPMVDDTSHDLYNTMVSLNMALMSPGGSEYTAAECREWMAEAGFVAFREARVGDHDTLVIATKPS